MPNLPPLRPPGTGWLCLPRGLEAPEVFLGTGQRQITPGCLLSGLLHTVWGSHPAGLSAAGCGQGLCVNLPPGSSRFLQDGVRGRRRCSSRPFKREPGSLLLEALYLTNQGPNSTGHFALNLRFSREVSDKGDPAKTVSMDRHTCVSGLGCVGAARGSSLYLLVVCF